LRSEERRVRAQKQPGAKKKSIVLKKEVLVHAGRTEFPNKKWEGGKAAF